MTFGGDYSRLYNTFSPFFVALVHKNLSYVECTKYSPNILHKSTLDGHKNNSTMVSNASPGPTAPKMNESFVLIAHVPSDRARAQDGYLKWPHSTVIDRDMR